MAKVENSMAVKQENGHWKCKICGWVTKTANYGPMNLHYSMAHPGEAGQTKIDKPKKKAPEPQKDSGCDHQWRLLRPGDQGGRGKTALDDGYKYVCSRCWMARKEEPR